MCQGKVKDNIFIWVEDEQKLVHKMCKDLQKNITIRLDAIKMGVQGRM